MLNPGLENRITAIEMYVHQRMKVNNVEVVRRMGKEVELLTTIKKRKVQYIGHIIRGERRPPTHFGMKNR